MVKFTFEDKLPNEEKNLLNIIVQALPYIAQIVGGDVVIFDKNGIRNEVINTDGTQDHEHIGTFNELCKRVMVEMRPSVGPSILARGCLAVRIPLNRQYGIAFNNRITLQKQKDLLEETQRYQTASYQAGDILGDSKIISQAKAFIPIAAKSLSTLLILGETGTGKELFAHAVHNASLRSTKPFVVINCGAIPENLAESVLFGYQEGAYTGASRGGKTGIIEQANGGTLFLDEISEMPFAMQVKLLRVIQEREVMRIGETKSRKIDVRFIAATNKNLYELVEAGKFRADLFYRLNVININVPPLRERKSDIATMLSFFVNKHSAMLNKHPQEISAEVMNIFQGYDWPGNVRELENCVEYMLNLMDEEDIVLSTKFLPAKLTMQGKCEKKVLKQQVDERYNEKKSLLETLKRNKGNKTLTAKELGIGRTTLWRKLQDYKIDDF